MLIVILNQRQFLPQQSQSLQLLKQRLLQKNQVQKSLHQKLRIQLLQWLLAIKPSSAPVGESFNGSSNKGVDYAGKMGDPVNAAADGKVIFSGNSLRSYGNLVIVKHNNSYITIYAHNSKNLVKEGDTVKRGQKIAEMGNTESESVKLHFELRKDSKPIDPLGYFDN